MQRRTGKPKSQKSDPDEKGIVTREGTIWVTGMWCQKSDPDEKGIVTKYPPQLPSLSFRQKSDPDEKGIVTFFCWGSCRINQESEK